MDSYGLTLSDTISPDDLFRLTKGLDPDQIRRRGEAFTCPFRYRWSPITWVGRLVPYYDGEDLIRTELCRFDGPGAFWKEPFDVFETYTHVRDAAFSLVVQAQALERLYATLPSHAASFGTVSTRVCYVNDAGHRLDLTKSYPHEFRLATDEDRTRADARADGRLPLATDQGDIRLVTLRRGRYPKGGLALEIADERGGHLSWLTADARFPKELDFFVCLDVKHLGPTIADWVKDQSLGVPTGDVLQLDRGVRYPVFEMDGDYVRSLAVADPFFVS